MMKSIRWTASSMRISMAVRIAMSIAVSSTLMLAACTHKNNAPGLNGDAVGAAQSYAMRDQDGFQLDSSGKRINPLYAPANQSYYFDFDANSISPDDMKAMNIQAAYLASHSGARIRLEGNTDNRGSREYNIGLGWRRDQAVARYFEQQGVSASQIQMVSYGKEKPLALGNNEHDWSLNRRVDLKYTKTG